MIIDPRRALDHLMRRKVKYKYNKHSKTEGDSNGIPLT
jgi:hypothetical protein